MGRRPQLTVDVRDAMQCLGSNDQVNSMLSDVNSPEAVDVAMDLARIPDPGMRKAVAEAMRALLKQYFRV